MAKNLFKSSTSSKLYITFFLVLMIYAFHVSCMNFYERTKFSPVKVLRHYSGNVEESSDESRYEYDRNLMQEGFIFPKTKREIIEITHAHAFAIPLIIFVMSRIFSMASIREGFKTAIYIAAFIGTVMNLTGPWLIRFKSDVFTLSLISSYFILGFCFLFFIFLPLYEMWFKSKDSNL